MSFNEEQLAYAFPCSDLPLEGMGIQDDLLRSQIVQMAARLLRYQQLQQQDLPTQQLGTTPVLVYRVPDSPRH